MRVLLFGTGKRYQQYKHVFQKVNVVALLDNDTRKAGSEMDGRPVMLPADGIKLNFDKIFILSTYEKEMRDQLKNLGVDETRVFGVQELCEGLGTWRADIAPVVYNAPARNIVAKGNVCIITWHLELSGGPVAMLGLAKTLLKLGYDVTAMAFLDGPMRKQFLAAGGTVIIDKVLCFKRMDEIHGAGNYCAIWTDAGLVLWMLVDSSNPDPVNMWFHAGECTYGDIPYRVLTRMNTKNVHFWAVGEFPRQAFLKRRPDLSMQLLPYGIKDEILPEENLRCKKAGAKIVFAIIGSVQHLKGQDIFLQAIAGLSKEELCRAIFRIIGKPGNQQKYDEQLMQQIEDLRIHGAQIECSGELSRESMKIIYKDIDVVISASREDAMSIVCTEGAMHCCAVVCSDQVGFKAFIKDRENGYIFKSEDSQALTAIFSRFLFNPDSVTRLGRNARKTYEQFFDMAVFQRKIENLMNS